MKIAIQGHFTKGKEVIQILEGLGGKTIFAGLGFDERYYYYINSNSIIESSHITIKTKDEFKLYTLEEFEKEFPFKIGDKVVCKATQQMLHTIIGISWDSFACLRYEIKEDKTGIITHCPTNLLIKYKEMKEERNITLTLEKAKEWYKKGGELKEVALQAYSEEELTKIELPRTWEEFCENYPVQREECWLGEGNKIKQNLRVHNRTGKNWIPSKKSAEAHLAMIQLEQLRDCYRQSEINYNIPQNYCIIRTIGHVKITKFLAYRTFLSFKLKETAEKFLNNFKDLIEKAGDLI